MMQFLGTLTQWNAERGFGFIDAAPSGGRIFVHASEFARDALPRVGMALRFELARDERGRKRAIGVEEAGPRAPSKPGRRRDRGRRGAWIIGALMVAILFAMGLRSWHRMTPAVARTQTQATSDAAPMPVPLPAATPATFRCDARQYCSQMTSCAEATWMLKNCHGMKVDGNHDGVPCEQQWCR